MNMRPRRRLPVLLLAVVAATSLLASACNVAIPTALPAAEQRWKVTLIEGSLGVDDLLAASPLSLASLPSDGGEAVGRRGLLMSAVEPANTASCKGLADLATPDLSFEDGTVTVDVEPVCVTWTLGELCPGCQDGEHPLPQLNITNKRTWELPDDLDEGVSVESVSISGGVVEVSLLHELGFTPIRAGELELVVRSLGTESELLRFGLDEDLVSGLPTHLRLDFDERPVTVTRGIEVLFRFQSTSRPGLPPTVTVDRSAAITAHISITSLKLAFADLQVDVELDPEEHPINFGDQGVDELVDRVNEAMILVTISNPFPVRVEGTLVIGERRTRVEIAPEDTSVLSVRYSRDDLRSLLHEEATWSLPGRVASDGVVRLDTSKEITLEVATDTTIEVGLP